MNGTDQSKQDEQKINHAVEIVTKRLGLLGSGASSRLLALSPATPLDLFDQLVQRCIVKLRNLAEDFGALLHSLPDLRVTVHGVAVF